MNGLFVLAVGRIVGGWPYVWAAYGIAWGGIAGYAVTLLLRRGRKH